MDGDDVGVIQVAGSAGFLEETLEGGPISLSGWGQLLDGDRTVEEGVLRQVDRPEGALAERTRDVVLEKGVTGGRMACRWSP
jgi:hypothetical protein